MNATATKTTTAQTHSAAPAPAADAGADKAKGKVIVITEHAADEIRKQRDKRGNPESMIRVGIRGGGCTGFSYVFEWSEAVRSTDKVFTAFGVSVVVDPKSLVYLAGMELDFVRGMMGHGFKFNNPNVKGNCGCGESVQF